MKPYTQAFIILTIAALPVSILWTSGHQIAAFLLGLLAIGFADGWIAINEKGEG